MMISGSSSILDLTGEESFGISLSEYFLLELHRPFSCYFFTLLNAEKASVHGYRGYA
jgi:hypothetical protein